jgi:hypothetical protein
MSTSPILGLTYLAENQVDQYLVFNAGIDALEAAAVGNNFAYVDVSRRASQTLGSGDNILICDTETSDAGTLHSTSTGLVTVTKAGLYHVSARALLTAPGSIAGGANTVFMAVRKNGTINKKGTYYTAFVASELKVLQVDAYLRLAASDTIGIDIYTDQAGYVVGTSAGDAEHYLQVRQVGY